MAEVKMELKEEYSYSSAWDPLYIKEEPESPHSTEELELSIKQEPEEFPVVGVKSECEERPTEEKREETNGEDYGVEAGCSSNPFIQFHPDSEEHTDCSDDTNTSGGWAHVQTKPQCSNTSQLHSESEESTDHSDDYSEEEALAKRSYAMIPPDSCVADRKAFRGSNQRPSSLSENRPFCSTDQDLFSCPDCGRSFGLKSHLQTHMLVHTEKKNKCSVCEKSFDRRSCLKTHMRIHTGEKPFICSVCEKSFVQKSQLNRHQSCVHHVCQVCSKRFTDRSSLAEHLKTHVDEGTLDQSSVLFRQIVKPFTCSGSPMADSGPDTGEKPLMCPLCDKGFSQRLELLLHKKLIHKSCPVCPQQLLNKFAMNVHLRVHIKDGVLHPDSPLLRESEDPFSCSDRMLFRQSDHRPVSSSDHRPFSRPGNRPSSSLDSSVTDSKTFSISEHRPFSCTECGESFSWDSQLQEHISHHRRERPHKCSICEKSFIIKTTLTQHQTLIHHICSVCEKMFSDRISLNEHLKTHVVEGILEPSDLIIDTAKPFRCPKCCKGFMLKSHFEVHVLNHKRERPHKCPVCAKTFLKKSTLNEHMRIHTRHRPFICPVCEKDFVKKSDLTRHQAYIHHVCPVCTEHFTDRISVKNHLKTHVDEGTLDPSTFLIRVLCKTHSCAECGEQFLRKGSLQKHEREAHKS